MHDRIPPQLWMLLPREERLVLAEAFSLSKSGISEIRDDQVISDGHNDDDLSHISRERMAEYVGEPADTELSFPRLWELTCAKAHSIVNPPLGVMESEGGVITLTDPEEAAAITNPKPTKNAKSTKAAEAE